ncbi:MAG: hypothetical protein ACOCXA_05900 [Planctomycetota bacterium]
MRILRRHRGFTTNSSSASEWADIQKDMQENPEKYGLPPRTDQAEPAEAREPQAEAREPQADKPETAQSFDRESVLRDNLMVIGGLVLAVLGIVLLERMLRRWLARRRNHDDL